LKNFEIPANEINALEGTLEDYYEGEDMSDGEDDSDIFPATFKITKIALMAYFKSKGVDPANVKIFNSEADSDSKITPKLSELMCAQWGFGDDDNRVDSEDLYFEYGWSANYSRFYELTINNKPAILIDGSDGTSSSMFSWIEVLMVA
jgi:hypothetical protein